MIFLNDTISGLTNKCAGKKIIFFGCGSWLEIIDHTGLMQISDRFAYIIDNNTRGTKPIGNKILPIYAPEKLREEDEAVVILTSPVYMYDMYCQLEEMHLSDSIICYAFPFVQMISNQQVKEKCLFDCDFAEQKIPKVIHSFWFSGDEKPYAYQKCVDTWRSVLADYKIIEWNLKNYDWHKHPFVERAIELKAWAYASDYARLDVLNQYGGIYLDMDVEVFKPFDNLLNNKAILSFANNVYIDLAVTGAEKGNQLIQKMLHLYDGVELPSKQQEFVRFFQPHWIRKTLINHGIKMNGTMQLIDDACVFPAEYFMPMDSILYRDYVKTDHTYCVHYDNFGWSFGKDNKKEKKKRDNEKLWDKITV